MLAEGDDIKTVSEMLGHSQASTTLNIYGHILEGRKRAAVDRLGERLDRLVRAK